ncbi:hypothetical protein HPB52_002916 [Rhipicephalus sanguineus]|uniref:Uncharacterized protein n=1 Tax=Rhipicephalus sanguineus TaxID=34632 RepID=A0A9D4T1A7_RHISA|nr:hypothetical protein HPB52_002916 [Rhipicephalus sanguineus]
MAPNPFLFYMQGLILTVATLVGLAVAGGVISGSGLGYTVAPGVYGLSGVGVGSSVALLGGGAAGVGKLVAGPVFLVRTVHHVTKIHNGGAVLAHSGLGGGSGAVGYGGLGYGKYVLKG